MVETELYKANLIKMLDKLPEKALKRLYQFAEYLYIHKGNEESEGQAYGRLKGVIWRNGKAEKAD